MSRRGATLRLCISCRSSLNAYATDTDDTFALSPHTRQTYLRCFMSWYAIRPHRSHTNMSDRSDSSSRRSLRIMDAPYAMRQSRSISPNRSPPPRALPSVGCFVSICTCPRALACILSATMWWSFW